MRKTIIFGALAALIGLAAVAQASDQADPAGSSQIKRDGAKVGPAGKHEREARAEDKRHDESTEKRDDAREGNDADEAMEHRDRR
jgi:hypothetical protein